MSHFALFHTIGDWELVRVLWYSNFTYAKYSYASTEMGPLQTTVTWFTLLDGKHRKGDLEKKGYLAS